MCEVLTSAFYSLLVVLVSSSNLVLLMSPWNLCDSETLRVIETLFPPVAFPLATPGAGWYGP